MKGGRPTYCYNLLGLERFKIEGEKPILAGKHQVRMEFVYDGGGLGKGGAVSLYFDGEKIGEGRIDRTQPIVFSLDDKTDVRSDRARRSAMTMCSGSRARVQPRNFFPHTPPSTTRSTPNAISSQPKRTACFALRR